MFTLEVLKEFGFFPFTTEEMQMLNKYKIIQDNKNLIMDNGNIKQGLFAFFDEKKSIPIPNRFLIISSSEPTGTKITLGIVEKNQDQKENFAAIETIRIKYSSEDIIKEKLKSFTKIQ